MGNTVMVNGWRDHVGNQCPVPTGVVVEVAGLDGVPACTGDAGLFDWGPGAEPGARICKYRVVPAVAPDLNAKPTNPKDAIGIRKAPLSTVPMGVVVETGVAMLEGAAKYGRHNYRVMGVRASVYFDAAMRHLIDWWEGVDIDPDSGMSHITKAIASLTVLRDAQMQGKCEDDRPPRSAEFLPRLNTTAAQVLDRHANKTPTHYTQGNAP